MLCAEFPAVNVRSAVLWEIWPRTRGPSTLKCLSFAKAMQKCGMSDRRRVRNHLKSIHAIALMNLAEASSGLAFSYSLPANTRAILTGLSIEYLKKARGPLIAECHCSAPEDNSRQECQIEVITRNESGDIVTKAQALWMVGPLK